MNISKSWPLHSADYYYIITKNTSREYKLPKTTFIMLKININK